MGFLKNHPGMWMRDDAANAINALEDKYGVITINRAGQTEAQQQAIIDRWDRGDRAGLFEPKRPARLSTHVINGGEAVDVYNFTSDRAKLNEFGFEWYGPSDPVHYTFRGWGGNNVSRAYADGSEEMRVFQRKLISLNHDLGPSGADGVLGAKTRAATKFEQSVAERNGYPVNVVDDGIPGPRINGYLDWWINGHRGSSGGSNKSVGELTFADIQAALNRKGYNLAVDNRWGPKSSNALADFQRRNGLYPDRIVGQQTWAKLNS